MSRTSLARRTDENVDELDFVLGDFHADGMVPFIAPEVGGWGVRTDVMVSGEKARCKSQTVLCLNAMTLQSVPGGPHAPVTGNHHALLICTRARRR